MLLSNEQLRDFLTRIDAARAAGHQPARTEDEVERIARSAGQRWALKFANGTELLQLRDAIDAGPQSFIIAFLDGVVDVAESTAAAQAEHERNRHDD